MWVGGWWVGKPSLGWVLCSWKQQGGLSCFVSRLLSEFEPKCSVTSGTGLRLGLQTTGSHDSACTTSAECMKLAWGREFIQIKSTSTYNLRICSIRSAMTSFDMTWLTVPASRSTSFPRAVPPLLLLLLFHSLSLSVCTSASERASEQPPHRPHNTLSPPRCEERLAQSISGFYPF